jgi:pimeloyl-ACP methyl ester carboxylesterase
MSRARNGDVEIEYEVFGESGAPVVLLVNGLGSQMTRWPAEFCGALAGKGLRPIRYDNRDTGLSTWPAQPYSLADMATDGMAVLDAENARRAHIAGVSMGGMIVQRMAIDFPDRVLSMTSIMSAPGAQGTLMSTPEAAAVLNVAPPSPAVDFQAFLDQGAANAEVIGSPGYPWPAGALRKRAEAEYRRGYNPAGVVRQRNAIMADGDRVPALRGINIPTVVLHGADDPLVQPIGGETTAAAISGAELRVIPGMGHDLPPGLYQIFLDAIGAAITRASP